MEVSHTLKGEPSHDPASPVSGNRPKKTKSLTQEDLRDPMSFAVLFTIAKM